MATKDRRTRAELLEALKQQDEEFSRLMTSGRRFEESVKKELGEKDRAIIDLEGKLARATFDTRQTQDALVGSIKTGHRLVGQAEGLAAALRIVIEKRREEDEEDPADKVLAGFDRLIEALGDYDPSNRDL
ncbi:MAG: hypothetical protein AMXMBFR44_5340 [Candidatus Campbellbacteria bacterium]